MLIHCGFLCWSPSVAEIDILKWTTGIDHRASALHTQKNLPATKECCE